MSTPGQRPPSSSQDLTLVVESESGTPEEFFAQVGLSMGRAKSNTIHIDHPDVDHIHAKVVKRGEAFWLRAEPPAKLPLLEPEPGEVEETELFPGLSLVLGGVILRCRRQVRGMSGLSDDYWAEAAGGERFGVETEDFAGDLPKQIGPYEIRKYVARGGMGIVLQGIHQDTALPAAVKLPTPNLNRDQQWLRRFEQEVRTLKSVVHPNLVRLQDAGREGELHWMAMDWVEGWTVGERLSVYKNASEPMPLQEIQLVLKQVVEGLVNLHAHGIVHRDLKPGNLLVGQDGGVKVADFGLAKQVGGAQSTFLTRTGTFAGTMHYMAPEQAEGMEITAATDIFALGVIWHELLTGRRPGRRLKLAEQRPDCPDRWAGLIEQCLEDEPGDRPGLEAIKQAIEAENLAVPVAEAEDSETDSQARPSSASPTEPTPWRDEPASPPVHPEEPTIPAKTSKENKTVAPSSFTMRENTGMSENRPTQPQPKTLQSNDAQSFTNSLGMKFVPVPGTDVLFCIWPTRVQDYSVYAKAIADDGHPKSFWRQLDSWLAADWRQPGFQQKETHPVVNVNWDDANAFCAWLTKKERAEGKITASQRYRLPTDAEWSTAVGLGRETGNTPKAKSMGVKDVYPWGTKWPPPKGAGNYDESLNVDSYEYTSPVGSFAANTHGLHDLGGNVWEWCEDWYVPATKSYRVLRGASWRNDDRDDLLSSYRCGSTPGSRYYYFGFRCVLVGE